jgi:hypothetical protein
MSVSLFAFMWFPFLSSPYGIQIGKHVSCDIFVSKFPKTLREWLGIFTDITSLIYIVALGYYGYDYFREAYELSYQSVGLVQYPLWLLRMIFPVSMFVCALQTVRNIIIRLNFLRDQTVNESSIITLRPFSLIVAYLVSILIALWVFHVYFSLGILVMTHVLLFWGVPILGDKIYDLSSKWVGWLPGGLAVATCITGGILAAMIGSSTAVTAIVTLVAIQPLLKRGYNKKLVIGTTLLKKLVLDNEILVMPGACDATAELEDIGYNVVVFPISSLYAAAWAVKHVMKELITTGTTREFMDKMITLFL